jgi:hypothetical protein
MVYMYDLNGLNVSGPNGLALEYKRDYGSASGNLSVLDFLDDATSKSKGSVLGLSLQEEFGDGLPLKVRALLDDRSNPVVIDVKSCHYANSCH